jgi:hypothetical protein
LPEIKIQPSVAPVQIEDVRKRSVLIALNEKIKKQDGILRAVAKEMSGVNVKNVEARKRNIWKSLRQAL